MRFIIRLLIFIYLLKIKHDNRSFACCFYLQFWHDNAKNSMFARLGADYEIRNQWFFAILEAMTTD